MGISRVPTSINRIATFPAELNVPVFISAADIYVLFPFLRKTDCGYADATGLYDFCWNEEMTRIKFVLVSGQPGTFAYNFMPGNWFPKRTGVQSP